MKATRASTAALAVAGLVFTAAGSAHALPLPDSSSCNQSGSICLQITNSSTGGNAGAISGTVELGTAVQGTGRGSSFGVVGSGDRSYGVVGGSNSGVGVIGTSRTGDAMEAVCQTSGKSALYAHNEVANGGYGVYAAAKGNGQAVHGENTNSNGYAGYFSGKVIATSYTQFSDARLKQNVASLPYGLDAVMQMRPVAYDWKEPSARGKQRQIGVIAQELRSVVPELVSADGDSGMLSVDYAALAPVLIKAVQEQQHTITAQQAQLREQSTRIAALERRLSPLATASLLGGGEYGDGLVLAFGAVPVAVFLALRGRRRRAQP